MHYFAIAVVVFAVALVIALAGCGRQANAEPAPPAVGAPAHPGTTSRAAIAKKLAALAASKPPTKLAQGAMCYKPAGPPAQLAYVCPGCHEKTVYAESGVDRPGGGVAWLLDRDLPECRRLVKEIAGGAVRLDETEFCRKCQPDAAAPRLVLVARYADDAKETRTRGVTASDLKLIQEFLTGAAKHNDSDTETPLKDHLPRLRELLGVTAEPPAQPPAKDKP